MALYPLETFKRLIQEQGYELFNFRRANNTLDNLGWNNAKLAEILMSLQDSDFQKTVPNCAVHGCPYGIELIDADQYEIHWNETNNTRSRNMNSETISLSLKIAIATDVNSNTAGVVTFHLS